MGKERLDSLLVARGMLDSLEDSKRVIRAGKVRVDGMVADKPGYLYPADAEIEVLRPPKYVSRGGEKLAAAFQNFALDVDGMVCLDVGASTGGFTDCLLQNGAVKVYAVDCGRGQLHWRLRRDERVVMMERTNARYMEPSDFDQLAQFAVVDASFISLAKLLPAIVRVTAPASRIVALIKPQFEARRSQVEDGGVVRDPDVHREVMDNIRAFGEKNLDLLWIDSCESPIKGPAGNIEFLSYWEKR